MLAAAGRYKWLVVGITLVSVVVAFLFGITRTDEYTATGTMVVEDPTFASALSSETAQRADRYLVDQMQIMRSATVAAEAIDLLNESEAAAGFELGDIQEGLDVEVVPTSNLLLISHSAESPETAIAVSDAVARAYQNVVQAEQRERSEGALAEIDSAIEAIEASIDDVDEEISSLRSAAPARADLEAQLEGAIQEIVELQAELAARPGAERADQIRSRLLDLQNQVATVRSIRDVDAADPEIALLQEERRALIDRRSSLTTSRNDVAIQSQLASTGVAFYSPPLAASKAGSLGLERLIGVGLLGGAVVGVSLAYFLANRNRVFGSRNEPHLVVEAPLLADVPSFSDERLRTALPTVDAPRSAAAEGYRFAAASLDNSPLPFRTLAVVSALNGSGKTTTLANLGIALAGEGRQILFIDADFGSQDLTRILTTSSTTSSGVPRGLTDFVAEQNPFSAEVQRISFRGVDFSLLSRGRQPVIAIEFFRSPQVRQFFQTIGQAYDLVLIDTPPLLQVAYSSSLSSLADAAVVIIEHESQVRQTEDMMSRLDFVGAKVAGYIYNRAPLRREMTVVEGSLRDIVGDQGSITG